MDDDSLVQRMALLSPDLVSEGQIDFGALQRRLERGQVQAPVNMIREYAEEIIQTVREPLLVLDGTLRVKAANQAFLRTFGVSAQETMGCFIYDLGNGQWDIPALRTLLSEILPINSVVHDFEVDHEFPNIGRRQMLLDGRMIVRGAEDSMILLAIEDVTVRKRAEQLLREHAVIMARSNRDLEEFASVASHDLQEPLRSISAFTDRLRTRHAEGLDKQGRDYLERVHGAARRMKELITALLTFARVGTRNSPFVAVELDAVARDVVKDMSNLCEENAGRIEVGELPTLSADAVQMRQLLQNLISNAIKFQRPGVPPHVVVKARLVRDSGRATREEAMLCELTVRDNGIGFEEKYLDRIFTIFERLHGRGQYEGSGVGLAICRRIAERHGGTISATSSPEQGATFTVMLPVTHAHEMALVAV